MHYQIPPDVQVMIAREIALGHFASEDEVLRNALQALERERNELELDSIDNYDPAAIDPVVVEGVRQGLEDVKAGRVRPWDEFMAEFRKEKGLD